MIHLISGINISVWIMGRPRPGVRGHEFPQDKNQRKSSLSCTLSNADGREEQIRTCGK